MDFPSKNMYDLFKDEIWKELGPLDPNWFEVLTARAKVHDVCSNQEGLFKTPRGKTSLDSQLFSTPKVFRHNQVLSPETEEEQLSTNAKGTLTWTEADSPCVFQLPKQGISSVKCGGTQPQGEDSFGLLDTPNKSPVSYAKHISESLGAQMNPDISWTSSLNTPPAVPSTLILSKADDSPCPVSVTADRSVVFVRKLFPSVSEASTADVIKNVDMPFASQGPVASEANNCPQSCHQSEGLWSHEVQDAVKDEDICRRAAAEDVPSVLFANSNSALRKVKPERIKRKQIVQTKESTCSSNVSTAPGEKGAAHLEPGKIPSSSLMKTGDTAISQWSPLSLSELPPFTEENNILTEHPQGDIDHLQLSRASVKMTESGFNRKKRKFVYTVGNSKPPLEEKIISDDKTEAQCSSAVKKLATTGGEILPSSTKAKVQELDMSQLCRDFAEEFSQMSDSGRQSKGGEPTQHKFSPSACLSAMKQGKQQVKQATLPHLYDGGGDQRNVSTNQTCSTGERSVNDSGVQSDVSNITDTTLPSFGFPYSENTGQIQQWSGSKPEIHMKTHFPSTKRGNGDVHVGAEAETSLTAGKRSNERQVVDPERESESCTATRQPEGPANHRDCVPSNDPVCGSLPEKTVVSLPSIPASGFKTASNKGIRISSANLERAKLLFQETEGAEPIKCDQSKTPHTDRIPPAGKAFSSQLTASQRADVNELCSLLEEADSQFEFTQFKTLKQNRLPQTDDAPLQKADKEIDPDFLAGIDFDDSFSDGMSNAAAQPADMSASRTLKTSSGPPPQQHVFEDKICLASSEPEHLHRAEHSEVSKTANSTLMLDVAFKSAGGSVLKVSRKCLSKARALFADLEENVTDQTSPGLQREGTDAKMEQKHNMDLNTSKKDLKRNSVEFPNMAESDCSSKQVIVVQVEDKSKSFRKTDIERATGRSDFHIAGGNQAAAFFKDCAVVDRKGREFDETSTQPAPEDVKPTRSLSKYKTIRVGMSKKPVRPTTKNPGGPAGDELDSGAGFSTANGENVSTGALNTAECPLNEMHTPADIISQSNQKGKISGTRQSFPPEGCGFQTAGGKALSVSLAALKKAKTLLSECEGAESKSSASSALSKKPASRPPPRARGFVAASGKPMALSSEALQKAKALFSDISLEPDIPSVSGTQTNREYMNTQGSFEQIQCRVPNAGAAYNSLSQKNPLKAEHLLTEFDDLATQEVDAFFNDCEMDCDTAASAEDKISKEPVSGVSRDEKNLTKLNPDQDVPEEPGSGCSEDPDKKRKLKDDTLPPQNGGFQTAGGRVVAVSLENLKKAKALFNEFEGVEDQVSTKPPPPKVSDLPSMQGGFRAASGKPVQLSSEALQKAKSLFSDISLSEEVQAVSHAGKSDKKPDSGGEVGKIQFGFTTAGGAKVRVSQKSLTRAKLLLKEFSDSGSATVTQKTDSAFNYHEMNGNNTMFPKEEESKAALSECGSERKHRMPLSPAQSASVSISEEPGNGCTEDTGQQEDVAFPPKKIEFQMASGKGVSVSSEALRRVKTLFNECGVEEEMRTIPPQSKVSEPPLREGGAPAARGKPAQLPSEALQETQSPSTLSGAKMQERPFGFTTAGGAKVQVSQKSLMRAKQLMKEFSDSPSAETRSDTDRDLSMASSSESKSLRDDLSTPHCGQMVENLPVNQSTNRQVNQEHRSQTASFEAPQRPGNLSTEYEGAEDKTAASFQRSEIPVSAPPFKSSGFLSAGGKAVAVSAEALQKAKALFTDIPAAPEKSSSGCETTRKDSGGTQSSFLTAGGGNLHVTEENVLKGKCVLKEFHNSNLTQAMQDADVYFQGAADGELELSKAKDGKSPSNFNVATARVGDVSARRTQSEVRVFPSEHRNKTPESLSEQGQMPTDVFECQEEKNLPSKAGKTFGRPGQGSSSLLEFEGGGADGASGLNLQSLDLAGCTENQQRFFAQEALDCTKALLEDEGLAEQSLSMSFENQPLQDDPKSSNKSTVEQTGSRKRTVGHSDLTGQPPLKRRLLEEFDRTVDGPRASALHPVKSCPNGLMKDRAVFQYSVSHQPNITKPHSDGKNFVSMDFKKTTQAQSPSPGDGGSALSKTPGFVSPFFKNKKTETPKNPVLTEKSVTPVFVPPFKKKISLPQESSPERPTEEEYSQDLFIKRSDGNIDAPPTNKTNGTADVMASVDTANNDTNKQSSPVDYVSQNIELARDMQEMRIRKKKRQTIRPLPGNLFLTRTSGVTRIPLKAAVNGTPPARYTPEQLYGCGVHKHVSEIRSQTAESFRFSLLHFIKLETLKEDGGVQLADGGWLIPSSDCTAGKEEFYRALCDTPGVDPKLISEDWVNNHYRWIVWKQASMERSFPETMGGLCLSPEQVLLQLKYRYDVEVDHSQRPALRKIMERDDTAAKTLVLCVCEVVSRSPPPNRENGCEVQRPQSADSKARAPAAVVWLTDGWYSIKAQLDEPLAAMLNKGLLAVGVKLIVHGAQLVGSEDACSPLEAPESLMLKICANSCRRARWDAKLGFHRDPRPFLLPLSCLYSNGGSVGCVEIIILRSYPIQWMERKPEGSVVFRSVRAEEKEERRHNSHKLKAMEMLFSKIQAEFEKDEKGNTKPQRRRKTISHQDIAKLQDGEELYEAIGDDLPYIEAHLSQRQLDAFHNYRRSLLDKRQAELQDQYRRALEAKENEMSCPKRDVTPVWRLCVADWTAQPGSVYQLNLWRPPSDLQSSLKEGCRYKVYNLVASDGKRRCSIETVQLTGTKKTQFQELKTSPEWLSTRFQPRVSTDFVNLQKADFHPLCGEIDLTGYVISIIDAQGSSPAFYLADGKLNLVKVRLFSSLSQAALEDVVKPRVLLALSNLQLRGQSMFPTPVVYAGDLTAFSSNPKEVHLQDSLSHLRSLLQGQENFFLDAEEKLSQLLMYKSLSSISSPALQPQAAASTTERKQDSNTTASVQKRARSLGSFTPMSKNPPTPAASAEKDPRTLKRRKALDYLCRIPSPPPLSFLGSLASPCIKKTFNPPRRSGTPSTLQTVQTPDKKPSSSLVEEEWVNDEELAMIDTQALHVGDSL
ncbi:breast cancer type 2 susceptibility protein isoform 2-T2 [Menidia menidia]